MRILILHKAPYKYCLYHFVIDHNDDLFRLLSDLLKRHAINQDTLNMASVIPQLLWSFLAGIRCYYQNGEASIISRMGWRIL